jgi:hypothetical protein
MGEKKKLSAEHLAKASRSKSITEEKQLQITDKYRVNSDGIQYIIKEKNGSGNWTVLGYHSTLKSTIRSLLEHVTKDDIDSLMYVLGEMEKIESKAGELIDRMSNLYK